MRKYPKRGVVLLLAMAMALSCTRESGNRTLDGVALPDGTALFTLPQLRTEGVAEEDSGTKTVYSPEKGGMVWSDRDTIGVFPQTGSPIYFPMAGSAGEDVAEFDGGGWKLKPSTTYYSFCPFVPDMYLHPESIPYTVTGQVQKADGSRCHDGFDCLWSKGTTSGGSAVNFTFNRLCCFFRFTFTPAPGTYRKLVISAEDKAIPVRATFDITASSPALVVPENGYEAELAVDIEDAVVEAQGTSLLVYAAFIPCNLTGKQITFTLVDSEGRGYQYTRTFSKAFEAGTLYGVSLGSLAENAEYYFLNQTDYGMYDLTNAAPVCTCIPGRDSYSYFTMPDKDVFRVMNPASGMDYKYMEMTFTGGENAHDGGNLEIYAPDIWDFDGGTCSLVLLRKDENGRVWLRDAVDGYGFIVKFDDK